MLNFIHNTKNSILCACWKEDLSISTTIYQLFCSFTFEHWEWWRLCITDYLLGKSITGTVEKADMSICLLFSRGADLCCLVFAGQVRQTGLWTWRTWRSSNTWNVPSKRPCDSFPQCLSLLAPLVKTAISVSYRWVTTLSWNSSQVRVPQGAGVSFFTWSLGMPDPSPLLFSFEK